MKKAVILTLFTIILSICSLVHAQTIIWVSEWKVDANGIPFDMGWVDLLRSQGYNVIADTTGTFEVLNTAKISALDNADLVIISRNTNSGGYIDGGEITQWNSIDSPLILLNSYLTRTSRWQWINSSQVEEFLQEGAMDIVDESHDIFKDISANNGQVDMIDESVNKGEVTFITSETIGNGTILARRAENNYVWIAEWEAGTAFNSGTSQKPLEKRMFFAAGGSAGQESGSLNLTETGKSIFLNSVNYMLGAANKAKAFYPANNAGDIEYDPILSWIPGTAANTHNVFFGRDFNDVQYATISEPLGTIVSAGQPLDANNFVPGILEFGQTYYWRVDEIDEFAEVYKGNIWSFTVEKAALDLPFANIANVTAISSAKDNDPNNTVNGSGLGIDPNFPNRHEISSGLNSWVSSGKDTNNVWIQYDFDKLYRIHEMLVWNYNHTLSFRYGFKDVLVQYSIDGQAWVDVPDANYFNKAANNSNYEYNTTVDFNDVVAKSVRITAFSNHGTSSVKSYGLAEVRFTYVPVYARIPTPADNAQNVAFGTMLKWRKGREALTHKLYIGTDEAAVTNGAVTPATLTASSYLPNLSMGNTYYWRVDEINNGMDPSLWKGDVWSFSVPSTILIEGFESGYGNDPGSNAVFLTWKDGAELGDGANGSYMGRKDTPYLHTINHSGGHSAPMQYDNESYSYSEVTAETSELLNGSDWSKGSPKTLTIWFRGDPNVTDVGDAQLYCEIGGKKAVYTGSINALTQDIWRQWDINLTTLGVNLSNITTITIGVEKIGSKGSIGVIYLDDIMLTGTTALVAYPDVFVEAEAYSTITSPMEVNNVYPGASGDQYIKVKNGTTSSSTAPPTDGHVTYQVNLTGGKYVIWGRVSIEAANQDAFWVKVDGAASDVKLDGSGWCKWNAIPAGAAWHWDDVHCTQDDYSNPKVTWTLPAGVTTISIAYRDSDAANPPRLDCLLIEKVGE